MNSYTKTEIYVWGILHRASHAGYSFQSLGGKTERDAGDEIIRLAEQIKAERAVMATETAGE